MALYTGTTNKDGSGSASNLNQDNASYAVSEPVPSTDENLTYESDSIVVSAPSWNAEGYKEVKIDGDTQSIIVNDFVDIDIDNHFQGESTFIDVSNAKRGEITTGDADDTISVSVKSNSAAWNNHFEIESGNGDDKIQLTNAENSQFTSFTIDAGNGDDVIDVSTMNTPYSSDVSRSVDGGEGQDILYLGGDTSVAFSNMEAILGNDSSTLTITSDMLTANNSENVQGWGGLVIDGFDITLSDDLTILYVDETVPEEQAYLESLGVGLDTTEFCWVNVSNSEGEQFNILVSDPDYLALADDYDDMDSDLPIIDEPIVD